MGRFHRWLIGMGSYILLDRLYPNAFGMHTVILPILLSLITFVIGSLIVKVPSDTAKAQIE